MMLKFGVMQWDIRGFVAWKEEKFELFQQRILAKLVTPSTIIRLLSARASVDGQR